MTEQPASAFSARPFLRAAVMIVINEKELLSSARLVCLADLTYPVLCREDCIVFFYGQLVPRLELDTPSLVTVFIWVLFYSFLTPGPRKTGPAVLAVRRVGIVKTA